jgi:hypothetical protein
MNPIDTKTTTISLGLTVDEINYVVNALAACPYREVQPLITKLADQSNAFIAALNAPPEPEIVKVKAHKRAKADTGEQAHGTIVLSNEPVAEASEAVAALDPMLS